VLTRYLSRRVAISFKCFNRIGSLEAPRGASVCGNRLELLEGDAEGEAAEPSPAVGFREGGFDTLSFGEGFTF
jgi:hypothetical protein